MNGRGINPGLTMHRLPALLFSTRSGKVLCWEAGQAASGLSCPWGSQMIGQPRRLSSVHQSLEIDVMKRHVHIPSTKGRKLNVACLIVVHEKVTEYLQCGRNSAVKYKTLNDPSALQRHAHDSYWDNSGAHKEIPNLASKRD